jgi:putative membrane protein
MLGMLSLWAVVGSPLSVLDHQLLTFHMVQHLLLMTVAAPLILIGAPVMALLEGLPPRLECALLGLLRWLHPAFCWLISAAVVIAWHVPAVFALGMQSAAWHRIEHTCFLVAGLLFWWPVIQPWPSLATVPLYLFLAVLPCDALAAFLTFCDRVVYPHYLHAHRFFDISPLGDQQFAGALMWVWITLAYLLPAAAITIQLLSPRKGKSRVEVI